MTAQLGLRLRGVLRNISSKIPLWFETSPLRGKRVVDKTAKPMKSFSVTPPFREGQSARPLSVGRGVSRRMGRLWIETYFGVWTRERLANRRHIMLFALPVTTA